MLLPQILGSLNLNPSPPLCSGHTPPWVFWSHSPKVQEQVPLLSAGPLWPGSKLYTESYVGFLTWLTAKPALTAEISTGKSLSAKQCLKLLGDWCKSFSSTQIYFQAILWASTHTLSPFPPLCTSDHKLRSHLQSRGAGVSSVSDCHRV